MRILIVEDEDIVGRRLQRLLQRQLDAVDVQIQRVDTVAAAFQWIATHPLDLLFLDLNLNGRSGFEVLNQAVASAFQTIIVSAHDDQAIKAFEYGVTDFIAKPYDQARLALALSRVQQRDAESRETMRILAVRLHGEIRTVPVAEVLFVQGAGDYAELHCADGQSHLHDKSLNALEHLLPSRFMRVHRSYLVNLSAISSLRSEPGSRYSLKLRNGEEIPVSRARVAALREQLI